MKDRPKIEIIPTLTDQIIEIASWCALISFVVVLVLTYGGLPDTIPVHYNLSGKVDRTGDKSMTLILFAIALILFAGLTWLQRKPHIYNYPTRITPENARRQYTIGAQMVRVLKLLTTLEFFSIYVVIMLQAKGVIDSPGLWLILPTLLIPGFVCVYVIKALRR